MSRLALLAPLQGWSAPLDEVPDAVFSARMLGDGLAIDPTAGILHAPCDGTIVTVAAQKHAVTLRAVNGAEILMHVGIDTVTLAGQGFELHVAVGQHVKAGERLLTFDLDLLARKAKSVITPVIVTDGDRFSVVRRSQDRTVAVGDFLLELQATAAVSTALANSAGEELSRDIVVRLEHGIHARPAALLAGRLKSFAASVTLEAHGRSASARSPVAMMALGVRNGDTLTVHARGVDAPTAVSALEAALNDVSARQAGGGLAPVAAIRLHPQPSNAGEIKGVVASPGVASGPAVHLVRPEIRVEESGAGISVEGERLERALKQVTGRLQSLANAHHGAQQDIVGAHLAFLEDPQLLELAHGEIANGKSAGYSWRASLRSSIDALRASGDARIAERVDDLLDLESQVLLAMDDRGVHASPATLPERAILLAKDLLPSQLIALDESRLAGICIATGGPTSHVAILAAALDIPTLVAMGAAILDIRDGAPLVIDADAGVLRVAADPAQKADAEQKMAGRRARRCEERELAQRECRTADGERIEMFANVGSLADAHAAVAQGAEGCGLLRTEFLFLDRQSAPTPEEQTAQYAQIAAVFGSRPVVIRTLDIGGDKPVPYIQLPREENPALGLRGIRVSFDRPDLLRQQLSAILRIGGEAHCHILLPMITDASEIRNVREVVDSLRQEFKLEARIPVGAMIETPAAAVGAAQIAAAADFLSIGTNDLTQYTLAVDRAHPELAARFDARHPAVLRLIEMTAEAGAARGKPVAVCGGLASDAAAVPVLIGLGIRELSVVPAAIPHLKHLIGTLTLRECAELAAQALER